MKRLATAALLVLALALPASSQCLLTFQTESIPEGTAGTPIHFTIEAVSGTEPYTFTLSGGTLPDGVRLHSNGRLTGVPREAIDTTIFVTVTDAEGCSLTQAFAFRVNP